MEMVVGKRHDDGKRFACIVEEAFHLSGVTDLEDFLPFLRLLGGDSLALPARAPFLVPHKSIDECQVVDISVPCGTMLLVNAYKLHRDPELWKESTQFKPDRFERMTTEAAEGEGYRFMPFRAGRRRCP
ncbi:Cytochrome P450 [Canna indica]|uniref:Cytochrome P450 n=1 Tax=Canna indica TaxID=4628 RepID=A0AAQ3KK65_9LILI|nr:Cytochrome P450 [Canna indica]